MTTTIGERVFSMVQYGKEVKTTHGTAVPATGIFPGIIRVPKDRNWTFPEENLGLRSKSQRAVNYQLLCDGISLSMKDSIFQKLPLLLSMVLKGDIAATETTPDQDDYLWDFTPSLTASNTPDSCTLEFGDNTQAYEVEYCIGKSIKFSGNLGADEAVNVEVPDIFGRQITKATFTPSLALSAGEAIIANKTKFYLDATWANLGTTEKTGLLRKWSVEIKTGNHPNFQASGGNKYFTNHSEGYLECLWALTFEGNSDAVSVFDLEQAGTPKALRLSVAGAAIGTGGPHSLIIDGYGNFEEVIPLGEEADGNDLYTAIFRTIYDGVASPNQHQFGVKVTTNVNAI